MTEPICVEELREFPEIPESEFEWEDLLLRIEVMSRALRVEMENVAADGAQPLLAELTRREAAVQRLLEEVALVEFTGRRGATGTAGGPIEGQVGTNRSPDARGEAASVSAAPLAATERSAAPVTAKATRPSSDLTAGAGEFPATEAAAEGDSPDGGAPAGGRADLLSEVGSERLEDSAPGWSSAAGGASDSGARGGAEVDRFVRLRGRNFAMLQRRGIDVWNWRIRSGPGAGATVFQLLSLLARGDVEILARLRQSRTQASGSC